jgi:signal transduction histidine kinase
MDTKIIIVLGASVFAFSLLLFLFSFVYKYQKRTIAFIKEKELMQARFEQGLLQAQIEIQEATFASLGKELHDNIGQLLSTTKMLLGVTQLNLQYAPDALINATETVGAAINELRALSKSLNKEWLEQFDLVDNLRTEINRINSANVLQIHLNKTRKLLLKPDRQIILFRIIQEAVQNAVKHSNASNIYINIDQDTDMLLIKIEDDGKGFDTEKLAEGVGIINMKNRIKLLKGDIKWVSSEQGSIVQVKLHYL